MKTKSYKPKLDYTAIFLFENGQLACSMVQIDIVDWLD